MRRGFTLAEIVIVLIVLVALAALVVPLIGGLAINGKSQEQIATEASMRAIRDAVMGTSSKPGAWPDLGQRPDMFPQDPQLLLAELSVVQGVEPSIVPFDPVTKIGWRGPYLSGVSKLVDGWGNSIVIQVGDVNGNGQLDDGDVRYARLVSAGENEVFETEDSDGYVPGFDPAIHLTLAECGDDVVIFFRVADTRE